jgi:norsolorinic acid ketoreductase
MSGIGKGLVAASLDSSNTTVVAAVRDFASAGSLRSLPKAAGSRLVVIEIDVASADSIKRGIASLELEHEINSLDVVLANAGIAAVSPGLIEMGGSEIQPFLDVNAYGQLELFKAVVPLLRRSKSDGPAKFMYMSSLGGSLNAMNNVAPLAAYGASKALGNFLFKWLSLEQRDIVVWSQHPG